jgi:cytoskeletal protein RodZ
MFERNRIADTLRSAREKRGLSLEQAASAAGIPTQYLRLLEGEANVRVGVSDELYLIPFFRKYARFVGIDAEELLPEFLGMVQQMPGEGSPPVRLAYRPRYASLWRPVAVLSTIAVAAVLLLHQPRGDQSPTDDGSDESSAPVAIAGPTPTIVVAVTPVAAAVPVSETSSSTTIVATPNPSATRSPSLPRKKHGSRSAWTTRRRNNTSCVLASREPGAQSASC